MTTSTPRSSSDRAIAQMRGSVSLVQERRFQLVDESSVAHPCLLAAEADFDPRALHDLVRSGTLVTVTFRKAEPGVRALVVTAVEPALQTAETKRSQA